MTKEITFNAGQNQKSIGKALDQVQNIQSFGLLVRQDSVQYGKNEIEFLVDPGVARIVVMIKQTSESATADEFSLIDPDNSTNFDVVLRTGRLLMFECNDTSPGIWRLISNTQCCENYAVNILAVANWSLVLNVNKMSFQGRYPTLDEIEGNPVAGQNYTLTVKCNRCQNVTEVSFISCENGTRFTRYNTSNFDFGLWATEDEAMINYTG